MTKVEKRCTRREIAREGRGHALADSSADVQNAQRLAAMGISLRHSGHFLLVGSARASLRAARAFHAFIEATMKKYTAAATNRKLITSFTNIPYVMSVPLTFA